MMAEKRCFYKELSVDKFEKRSRMNIVGISKRLLYIIDPYPAKDVQSICNKIKYVKYYQYSTSIALIPETIVYIQSTKNSFDKNIFNYVKICDISKYIWKDNTRESISYRINMYNKLCDIVGEENCINLRYIDTSIYKKIKITDLTKYNVGDICCRYTELINNSLEYMDFIAFNNKTVYAIKIYFGDPFGKLKICNTTLKYISSVAILRELAMNETHRYYGSTVVAIFITNKELGDLLNPLFITNDINIFCVNDVNLVNPEECMLFKTFFDIFEKVCVK